LDSKKTASPVYRFNEKPRDGSAPRCFPTHEWPQLPRAADRAPGWTDSPRPFEGANIVDRDLDFKVAQMRTRSRWLTRRRMCEKAANVTGLQLTLFDILQLQNIGESLLSASAHGSARQVPDVAVVLVADELHQLRVVRQDG
jgi:hypothetical protein